MGIRMKAGSVVGKKEDNHWAQVLKTPHGFGVVEIEDDEGHAQTIGMELLRKLTEILEKKVSSIGAVFRGIEEIAGENIQTLLLCIPIDDAVAIVLRGEGTAFLKRDGHVAVLRSSQGTVSGVIQKGDMVFLGSRTLIEVMTTDELVMFFEDGDIEETAEKLAFELQKKGNLSGYAGLFVEADSVSEDKKEEGEKQEEHTSVKEAPERRRFGQRVHIANIKTRIRPLYQRVKTLDTRIAIALAVLFLGSVIFGISHEIIQKKNIHAEEQIKEIERLYDEGSALLDLNAVKSKERLLEAQNQIFELQKTVSGKTKDGRKLTELSQKIAEILPRATQEYAVTPELFFDVALLKPNSKISAFGLFQNMMGFIDSANRTLFSLDLETKKGEIKAGADAFNGVSSVAVHGNNAFALVPDGIHGVNMKDKTVKKLIIPKPPDWGTIKTITAYAGNLYALDSQNGRIWKYVATGSAELSGLKFSDIREYLNPDSLPDLSKATTLSIDSSVWVGTTDGRLLKFTQGKEDTFVEKGVEPPFGMSLALFTDDNCEFLYVLDEDNKRVVVMEKDGIYKAQYKYPSGMTPSAIAAVEKLGMVFLFIDGKLYNFSLTQ